MEAATAFDSSGVEYYFECTAGGGHDSGWQDSVTYQDTGLQPDTRTHAIRQTPREVIEQRKRAGVAPALTDDARVASSDIENDAVARLAVEQRMEE